MAEGSTSSKTAPPCDPSPLRRDAEARLKADPPDLGQLSIESLLHEFQVHELELEMQNEELRKTQLALEEARDRYLDLYELSPVGYLTLSRDGLIAEINLTGAAMLGVERSKLISQRFAHFVSAMDRDRWYRHMVHALNHPGKHPCRLDLLRGDDTGFSAHLDCLRQDKGIVTLLRLAIIDLTEEPKTEAAADTEQAPVLPPAAADDPWLLRQRNALASANLTNAELRVALLISRGLPTKQIARQLSVSPETINVHRKHIRKKLGLDGRPEKLFILLEKLNGQVEGD